MERLKFRSDHHLASKGLWTYNNIILSKKFLHILKAHNLISYSEKNPCQKIFSQSKFDKFTRGIEKIHTCQQQNRPFFVKINFIL